MRVPVLCQFGGVGRRERERRDERDGLARRGLDQDLEGLELDERRPGLLGGLPVDLPVPMGVGPRDTLSQKAVNMVALDSALVWAGPDVLQAVEVVAVPLGALAGYEAAVVDWTGRAVFRLILAVM